jgi:hypothetical protein
MASQTQGSSGPRASDFGCVRRPTNRARSNTAQSYTESNDRAERYAGRQDSYDHEPTPEPVRMPIRSNRYPASGSVSPDVPRPGVNRATTYSGVDSPSRQSSYRDAPRPPMPEISLNKTVTAPPNAGTLRNNLRPIPRMQSKQNLSPGVFADDYDTATSTGSPEYDRSESPATSYGSLSRTTSNNALRSAMTAGSMKKAPPPPPPSRAKKPPPPIPARRDTSYQA